MMLEPNKKPRMPEEEALETSLHTYLKALSERPVTPRNLVELERATKLTRQLLTVGSMQVTTTGGFEAGGNFIVSETLTNGMNVGYDAVQPVQYPTPITQSSPAETFGASLVRELIASLKEFVRPSETHVPPPIALATQMSGSDLVYAIAMAREKGMKDLEGALIEKLLAMADKATDKTLEPESETDDAPCAWCERPRSEHVLQNGASDGQGAHVWTPKKPVQFVVNEETAPAQT